MNDPASLPSVFAPGNVAVVTGAASGIGLAAARRFAGLGMTLVMADFGGKALERAAAEVAEVAEGDLLAAATDVSQVAQLQRLRDEVASRFGSVSVLMNNAGVGNHPGLPWENGEAWQKLGCPATASTRQKCGASKRAPEITNLVLRPKTHAQILGC